VSAFSHTIVMHSFMPFILLRQALVGTFLGALVGNREGSFVGNLVGGLVGRFVGGLVGSLVGDDDPRQTARDRSVRLQAPNSITQKLVCFEDSGGTHRCCQAPPQGCPN
jgi:outer membrane lipoprotein SlyB